MGVKCGWLVGGLDMGIMMRIKQLNFCTNGWRKGGGLSGETAYGCCTVFLLKKKLILVNFN